MLRKEEPRKTGIVRKTFAFLAALITLVLLLAFLALYFIMPGYYHSWKRQTLQSNANALAASLRAAEGQQACSLLISDFVSKNNATVMAFDAENMLLPELSSPFVTMRVEEGTGVFYSVIQGQSTDGAEGAQYSVIIRQTQTASGGETAPHEDQPNVAFAKRTLISSERQTALSVSIGTELVDHISVTSTLQPIDEAKEVIVSLLPYMLVIGVALALLCAWLYARQISKPVLSISDAAVRMQRLDPDTRSGIRTNDELGVLSSNLDTLYESLIKNIASLNCEMEKVAKLEQSKTEMMQSASHELKTPIAALGGMLDGMLDGVGAYKDRDKYLGECKAQVEKLSILVSEILNASRADSSEQEPALEETRLDALVEQALAEYAYQLREKRLAVSSNMTETTLYTDPTALYRALTNLVSNAARYTPEGGEVRLELSEKTLSIENQCEPIPEGELPKMFEPFYTRNFSRDRSQSGVGLGLYIVKRNLERLGVAVTAQLTDLGLKITLRF